jgi:hypothetical protein
MHELYWTTMMTTTTAQPLEAEARHLLHRALDWLLWMALVMQRDCLRLH